MKSLTLIVAANHRGAIGVGNDLPWRLRSDLRFFRQVTTGGTVLMGRKTYESLGSKPLPNRFNVVLSHNAGLMVDQLAGVAAHSVGEAIWVTNNRPKNERAFVIGGASIYEQFLPYVDRCLLTVVNKEVAEADTFLDTNRFFSDKDWKVVGKRECPAGEFDEVNFAIFELRSLKSEDVRQRMSDALDLYQRKARGSRFVKVAVRRSQTEEQSLAAML
jgi:dihydrofolate reductase